MAAIFESEHVIFGTHRNGKQPNRPVAVQNSSFIILCLGSIRMDYVKANHVIKGQFYKGIIAK